MELKGEIESNATVVGDFNIPLSTLARSLVQKINKDTAYLSNNTDQMTLLDRNGKKPRNQ